MTDTALEVPTVTLRIGDREFELPLEHPTVGQPAFNIGSLLAKAGVTTLDYGVANTASTRSAITYIDGDAGILRYRGYPIEQLAEQSTFLETAYLLIYGELPSAEQLAQWEDDIRYHTMIDEDYRRFFLGFPRKAHPMGVLGSGVMALSTFYPDSRDPFDPDDIEITTRRVLAKLPTIAAAAYKHTVGQPQVYPLNALDYESNFLRMMFAVPTEPYEVDEEVAASLRVLLILHADHEQNCSTSTVRLVGSSRSNLYASVAAGVAALWGPLHGGANQEVLEMLLQIQADGGDVDRAIARAKDHDDPFRLMGFGHRVYKNYDPRARIIKKAADTILAKMSPGERDPLLDIALELEDHALHDDYFVSRKLYPNVDFYSGLIYHALGFPKEMFTVLFAIGRAPGWIAQWRELITDHDTKIGRPRQLYTGIVERPYLPIDRR
jgi:citrate synthase